jgi:hypothetical protein
MEKIMPFPGIWLKHEVSKTLVYIGIESRIRQDDPAKIVNFFTEKINEPLTVINEYEAEYLISKEGYIEH